MSTYCIGDVHGCYDALRALLQLIKFDDRADYLYFTGDLVGRGPNSLAVLRLVKQLPNTIVVLGNHDLHLLALYYQATNIESKDLHEVLHASDCASLIQWLKTRHLLFHDQKFNAVIVHAGIPPQWSLIQARALAAEAEQNLQKGTREFFQHMYGDEPHLWYDDLQGLERFRFIINALTRMRFCSLQGELDFTCQRKTGPKDYLPWFRVPGRCCKDVDIIYGHWAALEGKSAANVYALDTGCVWGGSLTAMRLEDKQRFEVPAR